MHARGEGVAAELHDDDVERATSARRMWSSQSQIAVPPNVRSWTPPTPACRRAVTKCSWASQASESPYRITDLGTDVVTWVAATVSVSVRMLFVTPVRTASASNVVRRTTRGMS